VMGVPMQAKPANAAGIEAFLAAVGSKLAVRDAELALAQSVSQI